MRPEVDIRYLCRDLSSEERAIIPGYYYDPGRQGDPYATNWWTSEPLWPGQRPRDPWAIVGGCSGLYGGFAGTSGLGLVSASSALFPGIFAYNRSAGFNTIFPYFSADVRDALAEAPGVSPASMPLYGVHAVLDLPYRDFDDYLQHLPSQSRAIVRRDRRRFAASQFGLFKSGISESASYFAELWDTVETHHGAAPNLTLRRSMLKAQADALDAVAHVFTVVDLEGKPIATSLNFVDQSALYCRLVGMDYAKARESGAYFEVMYYANIELSLAHGYDRVYFGMDALKAKIVRGSHLEPLYCLFDGMRGQSIDSAAVASISAGIKNRVLPQLSELSSSSFKLPSYLS